jgi:hypothetical protein
MKLSSFALLLFAVSAVGAPESFGTRSVKGKYMIRFFKESPTTPYRVSVVTREGRELFAFESGLVVDKDSILFDPAGTVVAFAAGDSFLMETKILTISDDGYSLLRAPAPKQGWDNYHQIPSSWDGSTLTLKINGPHAGKATGQGFSGTMQVRVTETLAAVGVVSEEIKIVEAGTGQPATRSQSKSESGDNPQPEAEGRSR